MVNIDFNVLVILYIGVPVVVVLFLWACEEFNFIRFWQFKDKIWQCYVCTHVYRAAYSLKVTQCPLCASYNGSEGI